VVLLKYALIMISDGQFAVTIHFEHVRATSVCYIMAYSCENECESGEIIQDILGTFLYQNQGMHTLHHLHPMIIVMEWVIRFIVPDL
jgi:Zn-finger protein